MFLLGHMCWAYFLGKLASRGLHIKTVNPYLIMFLGILPDIDFFLGSFGIRHRDWTHSILLWVVIFVPFMIKYRINAIPYLAAPLSHVALGDILIGRYTGAFLPFGRVGLDRGLLSIENLFLEGLGLAIFFAWAVLGKDRKIFLGFGRYNIYALLLIVPLAGFIILVSSYDSAIKILSEENIITTNSRIKQSAPLIISDPLFAIPLVLHVSLFLFLLIPLLSVIAKNVIRLKKRGRMPLA